MSDSMVRFFLMQMVYEAPFFLIYLVAFVLALIYIRQAALPSMMTIVAVIMLGSTSIGVILIQNYLIQTQQMGMFNAINILATCTRAVGTALLVAAVFVGRNQPISAGVIVPKQRNS